MQTTTKTVTMYICPTPDCPSVTTVTDPSERLEEKWSGPKTENRAELEMRTGSPHTYNRAQCPLCSVKGRKVQRVRLQIPVNVPTEGPPTPKPPQGTGKLHPIAVRPPEG